MRLSVRGLAGRPVRLDDALADWRTIVSARLFMQLTRVLREAVSNVIKHSEASRCEVRCAVDDGSLVLTVRDNGRGIAAEHHESVFRPFVRAHADVREGSGMGLAICRRIVERHGGRIVVDSEVGKGTEFRVLLPIRAPGPPLESRLPD